MIVDGRRETRTLCRLQILEKRHAAVVARVANLNLNLKPVTNSISVTSVIFQVIRSTYQ
jgi:hypothetical protein